MNDFETIYRPARPVDADQVHRLVVTVAEDEGALPVAPDEITAEDIRDRIRNATNRRNRLFMVATEDERVIGMIALETGPFRAQDHIRLLTMCVDPRQRRKGVGRRLLDEALDWARHAEQVEKIEIQVRESNEACLHLLDQAGFEIEGRLKLHTMLPSGEQIDDVLLALDVE